MTDVTDSAVTAAQIAAGGSGSGGVPDGFGFQVGEHALEAGRLGPVFGGPVSSGPVFGGPVSSVRAQDALEVIGGGDGQLVRHGGGRAGQVDRVDVPVRGQPGSDLGPAARQPV